MTFRLFKDRMAAWLEEVRLRMGHPGALMHLAVMGLLTGLVAGGVIVLFQVAAEEIQSFVLPEGRPENFEALEWRWRLVLPLAGGILIGLLFHCAAKGSFVLGVTKVLERMAYHQGRMDWRGFLLQFLGAAIAIICGHSVGREGPHVYLGAASGSLLGQRLTLPHNAIRTMVACGTAAAIAASFNTPLAGVIFSLEVVMMEYTVASFIPVILAAVSATALSNAVFGSSPVFWAAIAFHALDEIPVVLALGFTAGGLSALFNELVETFARWSRRVVFWRRVTLAGLLMGMFGILVPEVMGTGYDTVLSVLRGEFILTSVLVILLAKLLATSVCIGLGIPGGMIGPVLFMGAMLGALVGGIGGEVLSGMESSPSLYALLGLGAMMGASLQAPLAALTAMMELTHNPALIMPGMLAIVVASLTSSQLFGKESLFIAMLKANGMDYDANPVLQALRRVGVAGVMNRQFARLRSNLSRSDAQRVLAQAPDWLVIDQAHKPGYLMPAVDLARFLEEDDAQEQEVNLLDIPAQRYLLTAIHHQATLQEALLRLDETGAEAIYVEQATVPGIKRIYGILTRGRIESAYRL